MTENLENKENTVVNNASDESKKADEPKTYTQAEVDNIVRSRVGREKQKNKELKASYEELNRENGTLRTVSRLLDEYGGVKGTAEEQITELCDSYEVKDTDLNRIKLNVANNDRAEQKTLAYMNAKMFVEQNDIEDLQEEYDRINDIPEEKRNLAEREMFKQLKKAVSPKISNEKIEEMKKADREYIEKNFEGVKFDDVLMNEEFADFLKGTNMTVRQGMEKFIKLKGKDSFKSGEQTKSTPPSTGSVKDSGTSKLKEYYSPEDVDNLSEKDYDDPEIMKRVRESMTKW